MPGEAPLSTLLSKLLVAYTVEVDDLFEQRMPHSSTVKNGAGIHDGRPWLVSYVMWSNFLRHIDAAGTPLAELQRRASVSTRTLKSRLNHLAWWTYLTVQPPPGASGRVKQSDHVAMLSEGGKRACEVFEPLAGIVEDRWRTRFGARTVKALRGALEPFVVGAHPDLPRYLPVVEYGDGMRTEVVLSEPAAASETSAGDLLTLLAQTLSLFTLEFEKGHPVSLPLLANVLRLLDEDYCSAKELHLRAGVAKEGISAAITFLKKVDLVMTEGTGAKLQLRLSPAGAEAVRSGIQRLKELDQQRGEPGAALRKAAEAVLAKGVGEGSAMAEGLRSHEGGWRIYRPYLPQTEALLASPVDALPHHPMILHRGGFPDGS